MKTSLLFTKWFGLLAAIAFGTSGCATATAQTQTNKMRVGVYDSRAVAVAWANSTEFKDAMKSIEVDHQKAKDVKDEKRAKKIESQMQLLQRHAHEQGFSTGSVLPIMTKVQDSLPAIAKQAEVTIIVSKWELNYRTDDVELVDVTDKIVARFHVSEHGLKWSQQIQQKPPLPIEQVGAHMD
jgi:hypothetical protein